MRQTTLAVFAIVAIAAMMGVASVAPAYAAKKDVDTNETVTTTPVARGVCGVAFLDTVKVRTDIITIWDNGHYKMSVSFEKKFYAQDDVNQENLIAYETSSTKDQGTFNGDSEVITTQDKSKLICYNGEEGMKTHYVFTLSRSGNISEHAT